MEIIYRSFDGVDFSSAEDCVNHEQQFPRFKMWDESGLTTSPDSAKMVWLSTREGAEAFIKMCHEEDITNEGIEEGDIGIFLWSDEAFQWFPLDDLTLEAVKCYIRMEE